MKKSLTLLGLVSTVLLAGAAKLGPGAVQKLTPEEFIAKGGNADEYDYDIIQPVKRNGVRLSTRRWSNGVIPYVIDGSLNANARAVLQRAFNYYHQVTCIRWVKRTNQIAYVKMTKPNHNNCNSFLGKKGWRQYINLPDWCINSYGSVVHEMMHAIGFGHEQTRPDRDSYINIYWDNIESSAKPNFNKARTSLTYGTQYDYGSLMHYGAKAFSKNGQYTLIPKNGVSVNAIGQRNGLSNSDIYRINAMYKCNGKTTNTGGSTCVDQNASCSGWAGAGECQKNPNYMLKYCQKSCNVCRKRRGLLENLRS